ncbi:MAG: hypothetical protein JXO22_17655 [Phycisphaerae bacterium]|nr:hypothetical protein [Phycisphaerae bacterium]
MTHADGNVASCSPEMRFKEACARGDTRAAEQIGRELIVKQHAVPPTPPSVSPVTIIQWSARLVARSMREISLIQELKRPQNPDRIWSDLANKSVADTLLVFWATVMWGGVTLTGLSLLSTAAALMNVPVNCGLAGGTARTTMGLVCIHDEVLLTEVVRYVNKAEFSVLGLATILLFYCCATITAFYAGAVTRALSASLLRLRPEVAARLLRDSAPLKLGELVQLDRCLRRSGVAGWRHVCIVSLAFPELSMAWIVLARLSIRIMSAVDCGWYGYLVAFLLAWVAAFAADVFFMGIEGIIAAAVSRTGLDTTETYLDEILTTCVTIGILNLIGLGLLDLVFIGIGLSAALFGARAVNRWTAGACDTNT